MINRYFKTNLKKVFALFILFNSLTVTYCLAQADTVYLNNQKVICSVKEITPEAIKYTLPGEDVLNSVYKNSVQKVVFKSGRVQTFAEATSFKQVTSVSDFDKVTVTSVEGEVKGLYKLGDVGAKAKGTTVYSNQERVKDRAYRKLKIQAAMFGANIVFLTNQHMEGNKYGSEYTSGSTTETNLTGIAYTNTLPNYEKFKALIAGKKYFNATVRYKLGASDSDVSQEEVNKNIKINDAINDNGIISIAAQLQGEDNVFNFQLAYLTDTTFSIAYKYKGAAYNLVFNLQ